MKFFACATPQIVHIKYSSASICLNQFDSACLTIDEEMDRIETGELPRARVNYGIPELELTLGFGPS